MTSNQKKAIDYLDQYRIAKLDLRYLSERIEEQRAKAEGVRSCLNIQRDPGTGFVLEGYGTRDPMSRQRLLDVLVYQSMEYEQDFEEAELLARKIEQFIVDNCDELDAVILKYRYISLYTYEEISVRIHYSFGHIKRLHWEALERLGEKMSHNEP